MNIKNNKGITLSTVIIAVILLVTIMSAIVFSSSKVNETKKAMLLNNDIAELNRKVNLYYLQNGIILAEEARGSIYNNGEANYYKLILEVLDNINLNNQEEYDENGNLIKCYVINPETHTIYYVEKDENGIWSPVEYKYLEFYDEFVQEAKVSVIFNKVIEEEKMIVEEADGYFIYGVYETYVAINELTDLGKEQTELEIPLTYKGKPVTTLNNNAFSNNKKIESISIPGITQMLSGVFNNCTNLKTVKNPSKVVSMQNGTFMNCINLESINEFVSLKTIGNSAFGKCEKITDISGLVNLTNIRNSSF